jgi:hypothetical protein
MNFELNREVFGHMDEHHLFYDPETMTGTVETVWAQNLNEESLLRFLAKPQTHGEQKLNERLAVIKHYSTRPGSLSNALFRRKR